MREARLVLMMLAALGLLLGGCAPKIYGTVQLVDPNMKPVVGESPAGTVVNMINTTAALEKASTSATVDEKGKFESPEKGVGPGTWKVEVGRIGYVTETVTVEIGGHTRKELDIRLRKIVEGQRRSIQGSRSDEDKIINPGEVNIQPPMM